MATKKSDSVSIDDPVRLYLREMGTISLLTRKGEVEIAKRIEAGQHEVLSAVSNCGVTIREFIALNDQVKKGNIQIFNILQATEPEEGKEAAEKKEIKNLSPLRVKMEVGNGQIHPKKRMINPKKNLKRQTKNQQRNLLKSQRKKLLKSQPKSPLQNLSPSQLIMMTRQVSLLKRFT